MVEKSDPLDVTQLAKRDLTESAFPAGGKQDFRVYFDRAIHQRIASHAAEKLSLEICGVLVGHWHRDADGPFVLVEESIRCDKAVSHAGDVTFTHDAWNEVHQAMDTKFTDRDIVGWYHSHPNFGIFLSDRDCFIQDHFFNTPGQIAYVVDPVNGVEGVFAWHNGKAKLFPHFWVGNEIHLSSQGAARKPSSASPGGQSDGQASTPAPKAEGMPAMSSAVTWSLVALCFLLLGYLLGSRLTAIDRARIDFGAVAHYGFFKCLKPGLHENLDQVNDSLQKVSQDTFSLAKEHISSVAADAQEETKKQWQEVLQRLQLTAIVVQKINSTYSLTPEETAEVQQLINAKQAEEENLQIPAAKDPAAHDSGQKTTAAKTTGENAAAGPAKNTAAPAPAKSADTAKPAASDKKP